MYDKQGLRLLLDGIGPGYALESNSLRSSLEVFISDVAGAAGDAELALEKAQATRGLLAVQPNEPDLYGYTDENADAIAAFSAGRSALLDFEYGVEIVRLVMAAYLSAERGAVVDLEDAKTREELERYVPLIQQGRGGAARCADAVHAVSAAPGSSRIASPGRAAQSLPALVDGNDGRAPVRTGRGAATSVRARSPRAAGRAARPSLRARSPRYADSVFRHRPVARAGRRWIRAAAARSPLRAERQTHRRAAALSDKRPATAQPSESMASSIARPVRSPSVWDLRRPSRMRASPASRSPRLAIVQPELTIAVAANMWSLCSAQSASSSEATPPTAAGCSAIQWNCRDCNFARARSVITPRASAVAIIRAR
jgi:hypothetical protein